MEQQDKDNACLDSTENKRKKDTLTTFYEKGPGGGGTRRNIG